MKTRISILSLALCVLFVLPAFSADKKVGNPGKNDVILIGRIVVKSDADLNFIAKTRGVDEKYINDKPVYYIPFAPEDPDDYDDDYEDFVDDNPKVLFEDGEFFAARYKVNKKTRNLKFSGMVKYAFFGVQNSYIWLPFDFNIDVPEGVQAMYIGTFYFETAGYDFVFKKTSHVDEYELAQEALDKVTKKHFDLYRADLKENPKEEPKK
jgi:hypothetical protein